MRVVQRRLKQTEVMVWLTIVGILLGSVSVVAADWLTQRSELAVDAASTSSVRSRMALDVESMPSVETTRAKAIAKETSSTTADVARTTDAPRPVVIEPSTTKPPTTPAPTKPPTTKPPTTVPPETKPPTTVPPTTVPPETRPSTTVPPTKPTTTLPPETKPSTTQPPTTLPPETQPPETRPLEASITGFVLINAKSNNDIMSLYNGAVLSLAEIGNNLSIRAEVTQDVGSVVWSINGRKHRVENDSPYALGGNKGGNYGSVKFEPGTYTFKAQVFSKRRGRGEAGHTLTMTVTFTEGDDDPGEVDD